MKDLLQELLSEIFIACLPPPREIDQCIRDTSSPPLLLCQVCSSWRTVAINTPQLWTYLHIRAGHLIESSDSLTLFNQRHVTEGKLIELWGSRQGALPSSVSFRAPEEALDDRDPRRTWATFFGDMLMHPNIISCQLLAALEMSLRDIDLLVGRLMKDDFPNLEVLAISAPYGDIGNQPNRSEAVLTKRMPNLKRIYLGTHPHSIIGDPIVRFAFHWERITHLALTYHTEINILQWHSLLSECTSLTHLTAGFSLEVDETYLHKRRRQPVLRRGTLQEIILLVSFPDTSIIFIGFIYPSVTKLRISFANLDCTDYTDLEAIHALLAATPNVQELHTQYLFPLGEGARLHNFLAGKRRFDLDSSTENCREIEDCYPPFSSIVPALRTLVVDCIGESVHDFVMPGDFYIILKSRWLSYGWPSSAVDSGRSILFLIDSDYASMNPNVQLLKAASQHIGEDGYPFHPETKIFPGRQWDWKVMNGEILKYGWDQCSAWFQRGERGM